MTATVYIFLITGVIPMLSTHTAILVQEEIAHLKTYVQELHRVSRGACKVMAETHDQRYVQMVHEQLAVTIAQAHTYIADNRNRVSSAESLHWLNVLTRELDTLRAHKRDFDRHVTRLTRRWYTPRWSAGWAIGWITGMFAVGFFLAWLWTWINALLE